MVFWHTAWKKHHSWMIRHYRIPTFIGLGMGFYYVYWFNRSSGRRTIAYLDRIHIGDDWVARNKRDFGYHHHYQPAIARSRKNWLISQGDYHMRIPWEEVPKAYPAVQHKV